jgi:hypothetical protein
MAIELSKQHRNLCIAYGVIAAGALVATWSQNIRFMLQDDNGGVWRFMTDGYANPAAASLTNDLLFVCLAVFVFFFVEGRRLGVPHLWLYYLLTPTVALSVALPLFLIARQRRLAALDPTLS